MLLALNLLGRCSAAVFAAVVLLGWGAAQAQVPQEQTLAASDKPTPAFTSRIGDADFNLRYGMVKPYIRSAESLRKSGKPAKGVRIAFGEPAGEAAGLKMNDIITHANGKPLITFHGEVSRTQGPVELTYYRPSTQETLKASVADPAELITAIYYDYALAYIRSDQTNAKWDDWVVCALEVNRMDGDLAEACMARAVAAGFKSPFYTNIAGVLIASTQGRGQDAMAYLNAIGAPSKEMGVTFNGHDRMMFALAGGDLPEAYRQSGVLSQGIPDVITLRENLKAMAQLGAQLGPVPRLPTLRQGEFNRQSVLPIVQRRVGTTSLSERDFVGVIVWKLSEEGGYSFVDLQPEEGLRNGEIRMRFRAQPSETRMSSGTRPSVHVLVWDMTQTLELQRQKVNVQGRLQRSDIVAVLGVEAHGSQADSYVNLKTPLKQQISISIDAPEVKLDWSKAHELRIIVLEGWVQMLLDNRTVSFTPLEPGSRDVPLGLVLAASDMKTQILAYDAIAWTAKDSPLPAQWEALRKPVTDRAAVVHQAPAAKKPAASPSGKPEGTSGGEGKPVR